MYKPQHQGSHLRVPKRSIPEISDHLATGQHFPPDQNLVEQYNHVKGDGFAHPMRNPAKTMDRLKKL